MPPGRTVVVDANVLAPVVSCDIVLTAFDRGLVETVVSSVTLDEVERTLIEDLSHLDPTGLRRRVDAMRVVLEDHIVDGTPDAEMLDGINDKDRHVVACAIGAGATIEGDVRNTLLTPARIDADLTGDEERSIRPTDERLGRPFRHADALRDAQGRLVG